MFPIYTLCKKYSREGDFFLSSTKCAQVSFRANLVALTIGKNGKKHQGMDEAVLQNFVQPWNSLVQQRVGYECQQGLELPQIDPRSKAELPLLEDGSMGRALFSTLVPGLNCLGCHVQDVVHAVCVGRLNAVIHRVAAVKLACQSWFWARGDNS